MKDGASNIDELVDAYLRPIAFGKGQNTSAVNKSWLSLYLEAG